MATHEKRTLIRQVCDEQLILNDSEPQWMEWIFKDEYCEPQLKSKSTAEKQQQLWDNSLSQWGALKRKKKSPGESDAVSAALCLGK